MLDCRAGNALVEHDTHRVVIHDFAQCQFRDEVEAMCAEQKAEAEEGDEGEDNGGKAHEWEPSDGLPRNYEEHVRFHGNQFAIGMPLTSKLLRKAGVDLEHNIRYLCLDEEVDIS